MAAGLDDAGAGAPQGLSWSWELDFGALARCIGDDGSAGGADGGEPGGGPEGKAPRGGAQDEEAAQLAVLAAVAERGGERVPAGALAGMVAGQLPPGPDLAAWLATVPAAELADRDLAATAGSWRRIASWAQAQELAAVAQIASRAAAREEDIEVDASGRPARVPVSAAAEVSLELTMSHYGASWWADLAVDLAWRLAATGEALAAGVIDLSRARLIAEATRMLSDQAARAVEQKVLASAGDMTTGALRAALRRAVIAADPEGAERRRKEAERQAKVCLYPDEESTATLAGQRLPGVHAAAAMARIKAMARAMKASGAGGGMDLLSAQVYLGLLLGTLPHIPPAEDAPPDPPGDRPHSGPDDGPGGGPGSGPACGNPGSRPAGGARRDGARRDGAGRDGAGRDGAGRDGAGRAGRDSGCSGDDVPGDDVPPPGDADAPRDQDCPCPDDAPPLLAETGQDDDDGRPAGNWPEVPAVIPPAFTRPGDGQAAGGMLDLSLPWRTLAGVCSEPGHLGRIGPVTAVQARQLAGLAARNPAAEWRIIVTTPGGQAITVTRIPRPRERDGQPPPGDGTGLVSRVTLTIPEDILAHPPPHEPGPDPPGGTVARALQAAAKAAARARDSVRADAVAGGCAHRSASAAYRPPPRLQDYITARDLTCRFPTCRQPAWRGDLDHTIPHDRGGLTCRCNLGSLCRTHHQLKQHPGWLLEQTAPGAFRWTTPAGRTFSATPDTHLV
jgi:hypothetical protein